MNTLAVRRLALFILLLASLVAAAIAATSFWMVDHAFVTEKPIDGLELSHSEQATTTLMVTTTNRGCPAERFVRLDSKQIGYRIEVRAYYQPIPGVGVSCAQRSEQHALTLSGLPKGRYTAVAPTRQNGALPPTDLTFEVG